MSLTHNRLWEKERSELVDHGCHLGACLSSSSSCSAILLLLSITSFGGGGSLPVCVLANSWMVMSDRQLILAVHVEEELVFSSRTLLSLSARIRPRLALSAGLSPLRFIVASVLWQAWSSSWGIYLRFIDCFKEPRIPVQLRLDRDTYINCV